MFLQALTKYLLNEDNKKMCYYFLLDDNDGHSATIISLINIYYIKT